MFMFVRRRGNSTCLVEAVRDAAGEPRQRVLANLHGTASPLAALAKIAGLRERLKAEQKDIFESLRVANKFYKKMTTAVANDGRKFSRTDRRVIDRLLRKRENLLKRKQRIEADLVQIQKDGRRVKRYVNASEVEIQDAIRQYKKSVEDAEMAALGAEYFHKEARRELRRLTR